MPSVTCHLSSAPRGVARITHVHTHVASLRGVRCKLRSITCHVSRWYGTDLTSTAYVVHAENYDTRTPESHVHQAEVRPFTQFIWVATSGALHDVALQDGHLSARLGRIPLRDEQLGLQSCILLQEPNVPSISRGCLLVYRCPGLCMGE